MRIPHRVIATLDAAAISEMTKRAGLAVPIQNEATFLRAEALERLAVLVDDSRDGYHHGTPELREINRRVSETRTSSPWYRASIHLPDPNLAGSRHSFQSSQSEKAAGGKLVRIPDRFGERRRSGSLGRGGVDGGADPAPVHDA